MPLLQLTGKFETKGFKKIIFILDTSESAIPYWNEIASLTSQLITTLPKDLEGELYFLGNPNSFDIFQFDRLGFQFFEENRKRISIITPIFEKLIHKPDIFSILIIGSGKIFDLEDWAGSKLLEQTLLVSIKESLQGELSIAEEIFHPSVQQIYPYLYDPILEVEIFGEGFMPLKWSNEEYYLKISDGKVYLRGNKLDTYSIVLEYLIDSNFSLQAKIKYASGQTLVVPLQVVKKEEIVDFESGLLTLEEERVFEKAILHKPFVCPHCKSFHSWNTLYCLNASSILGELVYPSLNNYKLTGFVLFYLKNGKVYFQNYRSKVLLINEKTVAIREGRKAVVYKYDEKERLWKETSQVLTPYYKIKEGIYAVIF